MSFYFAWLNPCESFDATHHARQDESILHFDIDHQEGAVPLLRLTVACALHKQQQAGHRGILWQKEGDQPHLLFDGTLVANPAEKKEDFLLLVLAAGGAKKESQLENLLNTKKQKRFDPLLVPPREQDAVDEVLEALCVMPHWDRVTGKVSLTEMGQELERVDMGTSFFGDSLEIRERGRPVSAVRFIVTAEWVQRYDGVADLSPLIIPEGGRGYLSTLTPEDLQKRWWRKDYPLQRTGYEILESRLTPVTPPSTGGIGVYPLKSAGFTVNGKPQTKARSWMDPVLKLQWHYRQKRKETVHIEVPCGEEKGEVLELALRLQDICSPVHVNPWEARQIYYLYGLVIYEGHVWRATKTHFSADGFEANYWVRQESWPTALEDPSLWSFFQTDRGRQVIDHVIQRAEAYGWMAARRTEVRCRLPFTQGRALRGNQMVRLMDNRLQGGEVTGLVVNYRLVAEGDTGERWAEVVLAVNTKPLRSYKLKRLKPVKEAQGILNPRLVMPQDLVTGMQITHDAETQNQAIEGKNFPSLGAVQRALEKVPTRVKLTLKDLKATEVLSHEWTAELE